MNDWIKVPRYGEVTMSWEATPKDYALFSWMFPEPRVKRPMACLAPVDTRAHITKEAA